MIKFFSFRLMLTPTLIHVVFWLSLSIVIFIGVLQITNESYLTGGIALVLGPIFIRIFCEMIIVVFRIYEALIKIQEVQK